MILLDIANVNSNKTKAVNRRLFLISLLKNIQAFSHFVKLF